LREWSDHKKTNIFSVSYVGICFISSLCSRGDYYRSHLHGCIKDPKLLDIPGKAESKDRIRTHLSRQPTGHLDGTGVNGNLNRRNDQIRDYCRQNGKVLYDFADIESYDPDGNYFLDRGANDNCDYNAGNWATQWMAYYPGRSLAETVKKCDSCAHSQRLNCVLKGRAFWESDKMYTYKVLVLNSLGNIMSSSNEVTL